MNEKTLRFGIILNNRKLRKWEYYCVKNLLDLGNVYLSILIISDKKQRNHTKSFIKNRLRTLFFKIFRRLFVNPESLRKISDVDFLSGVSSIYYKNIKNHFQEISSYELDFIINFTFNKLDDSLFDITKYGIWSFNFGDMEKYTGNPPCFWEIYNNVNVTGAVLKRLTKNQDNVLIFKRGIFKTDKISYGKNLNKVHFESARWPKQVCIDILNEQDDYLNITPSYIDVSPNYNPTNLKMLIFIFKIIKNWLFKNFNKVFKFTIWNIGIVYQPIHDFLNNRKPEVNYLPEPLKDKFRADPFGICKDGSITILFENFDYKVNKGKISCIEISNEDFNERIEEVFPFKLHMAYPYLFEYKKDIYCIPQIRGSYEIALYKSKDFPFHWDKVSVIVKDVNATDSTIFQYHGKWWLTFTDEDQESDLNLFLWYSEELLSKWNPHANNPVKTDVRSARPAGTPFLYDGKLYRPAQDCSGTYGARIAINRILELTPTKYKEEIVKYIEPFSDTPYIEGIHTLSSCGKFTLIDGRYSRFNIMVLKHRLISKLCKLIREKG